MNLHKSKIEWCTHTWNPVTGCRNGCSYCYARRFIDRFAPHPCEWPDEPLGDAQSAEQLAQKYQTTLPKEIDVQYREVDNLC